MSKVSRKKVKVLTNGPIRAKGWVYGPILTPYFESTKVIFAMLKDSIKVVEVLNNGVDLVLNAQNFDKNNNIGLGGDDDFEDVVIPADVKIESLSTTAAVAMEILPEVEATEDIIVNAAPEIPAVEPIVLPVDEKQPIVVNNHKKHKKNK